MHEKKKMNVVFHVSIHIPILFYPRKLLAQVMILVWCEKFIKEIDVKDKLAR